MISIVGVLYLFILGVSANPYIVRFSRQLTPDFVASIEDVVGYECGAYVHPDGLLLYLNETLETSLRSHFLSSIRSITFVTPEERCSVTVATLVASPELVLSLTPGDSVSTDRAYLDNTAWNNSNGDNTTLSISLRILSHPGAPSPEDALRTLAESYAGVIVEVLDVDLFKLTNISTNAVETIAMSAATFPEVCFVEPVFPVVSGNIWSSKTIQSGFAVSDSSLTAGESCSCEPFWAAGIRGAGQTLAVSDTGLDTGGCFFYDGTGAAVPITTSSSIPADTGHRKVRAYWSTSGGDALDSDGHGTHVIGTALGQANANSADGTVEATDFNGVAPGARVVVIDAQRTSGSGLAIPEPYDTVLLDFAWRAGARVHSGSWGIADWVYSDEDRRIDSFCWHHRTFLAIFAAGNSGDTRGAASILSPALAKNAVAVAAAQNGFAAFNIASGSSPSYPADAYYYDWLAEFSSRGGAADPYPWMKPNIVGAGGRWIWSANAGSLTEPSCSSLADVVVGMAGTSMASPHIAGACLLVREYFMRGTYWGNSFEPTASLVKTVLAASAKDSRGIFPLQGVAAFLAASGGTYTPYGHHYLEGHGRADLSAALPLVRNATASLVLSNEHGGARSFATPGQINRFCLTILSGTGVPLNIVVALAYTDYPSALNSRGTAALVNDLDLRVKTVAGDSSTTDHFPNGLHTRDDRSPIETIRLASVTADTVVQVEVWSAAINFDVQTYSLFVTARPATPSPAASVEFLVDGAFPGNDPASISVDTTVGGSCPAAGSGPAPAPAPTEPATSPAPAPVPTAEPPKCAGEWMQILHESDQNHNLVHPDTDLVCCRSFYDIAEHAVDGSGGALDPLFERLAREYVAALMNVRAGLSSATHDLLLLIENVHAQLTASCNSGIDERTRETASSHLVSLQPGHCQGPPDNVMCVNEQHRANSMYCSGSGVFDFDSVACSCDPSRQQTAVDCASFHCSGNGASVLNDAGQHECACFSGWSDQLCTTCSGSPVSGLTYLCVGLDRNRLAPALRSAGHTHVLMLIVSATLSSRLDGSYYRDSSAKDADVFPGTSGKNCWCLSPALAIDPANYPDHAGTVAAAVAYWTLRDRLTTQALPVGSLAPPTSSPPPSPTAAPQPPLSPAPTPPPARNGASLVSANAGLVGGLILLFFMV